MKVTRKKDLIPAPKDGQKLYLVVKPTQLGIDKNSNWKDGSTVTVEVWKQKGNDEPTQSDMGDYKVTVYKNGTSGIHATRTNTPSFTFSASKNDSSYEVELKVNNKSADSKTVRINRDGTSGSVVTIIDVNGEKHWAIDGVDTGVKAEGKDGTGVNVQGSVDVLTNADITGQQTSLQGVTGMQKGDCYIVESNRHLYMFMANGQAFPSNWKDLGEFKGAPGADGTSNYIHLAHATWVDTENHSVTGFTVDSETGANYSWMGICVDNNPLDPGSTGRPFTNTGEDTAYYRYKWNFIKGKDGDNYENVYLQTKTNAKPGLDDSDSYVENGQTIDKSKDEYRPAVLGFNSSQHRYNRWKDDPLGITSTWRFEWQATRKKVNGEWGPFVISNSPIHVFYRPPFWSRVYKRVAVGTTPDTPTGGSYDNPIPSGWDDGIPDPSTVNGDSLVWTSIRKFSDDETTQWDSPQIDRDTSDRDIEYAPAQPNDAQPDPPGTPGVTWYDPSGQLPAGLSWSDMVWRAERRMENGVGVGSWVITRSKGEKGDPGGRATAIESWFCALASKPSTLPNIVFYSGIPYWTVEGSQKRWYKGQDDNWSESVPYLYRLDKYETSDGNTFWSSPYFSSEWADQGPVGPTGPEGNGVVNHYYMYLATTMASGVTRNTDAASWTANYQQATAELPYVWRYEVTVYRDTGPSYSDCELIYAYSSGSNANLLEQTNFSSLQALDNWDAKGYVVPNDGAEKESRFQITTGTQAHNAVHDLLAYGGDKVSCEELLQQAVTGSKRKLEPSTWYTLSFWSKGSQVRQLSISSGGYGYGVSGTKREIWLEKDHTYRFTVNGYILRNGNNNVYLSAFVWGPLNASNPWQYEARADISSSSNTTVTFEFTAAVTGIHAIESYIWPSENRTGNEYGYVSYYTIWDIDCLFVTHLYPNIIDTSVLGYIDGEMKTLGIDGYCKWAESNGWVRHTYTFKTKSTLDVTAQNYVLWRIPPCIYEGLSKDVYICMPKLEVGMQATGYLSNENINHNGQLRRRRWALNTEYMAGGIDERFDDVVLLGESGFYHCIKSHISDLSNKPTGVNGGLYWESAQKAQFEMLSTEIFFAEKALVNNLIASLIQTGYEGQPHVEAYGSVFRIFGYGQYPAIELAMVDHDNGSGGTVKRAVLRFYDEYTGEYLYDLGPSQINHNVNQVSDNWEEWKLKSTAGLSINSHVYTNQCTSYFRYKEGYTQTGNVKTYTSGGSSPGPNDGKFFKGRSVSFATIPDGSYRKPDNGVFFQKLNDDDTSSPSYIIYNFSGGRLTGTSERTFEAEII